MNIIPKVVPVVLLASAIVVSGCANNPDAEIARAKVRVEKAQQSGAGQYAAAELKSSEDNLRAAEAAADKGDEDEAREYAQKAELEAEKADAKASRVKAETAAREVDAGTDKLREETDRALTTPPVPVAEPDPASGSVTSGEAVK